MASAQFFRLYNGVFAERRVLVTGHTGFMGRWLCEWLLVLGAEVTGLALPPATVPSLFEQTKLSGRVHRFGSDIRVASLVEKMVQDTQPDFVFHLVAHRPRCFANSLSGKKPKTLCVATQNRRQHASRF